jgi:hypothetical protein
MVKVMARLPVRTTAAAPAVDQARTSAAATTAKSV